MSDTDDSPPLLYICRNIPGEHAGGPDCFCNPHVVSVDDDAAIARIVELGEHPEHEVS